MLETAADGTLPIDQLIRKELVNFIDHLVRHSFFVEKSVIKLL